MRYMLHQILSTFFTNINPTISLNSSLVIHQDSIRL